ncbi:MAG: tetratricopeptide (TPR) repeat protein [Arenicella sp.]|jgi:tetratricopeptide (TPR) repeat protein
MRLLFIFLILNGSVFGQKSEVLGNQDQYAKAIDLGDESYKVKNFEKALEYYREAELINPKEAYPKERILLIESYLVSADKAEEKEHYYHELIKKADDMFASKLYQEARQSYQKGLDIKPSEQYPSDQIKACQTILSHTYINEVEPQYKKIMLKAEEYYHNCQLDKAKSLYERCHSLKPSDPLPVERIENIDGINKSYKRLVQESENAFIKNDYVQALSKLQTAKELHPCTTELDAQEIELIRLTKDIEIKVVNEVTFENYIDYSLTDSVNSIEFKVVITNNSKEKIPDLGVSGRSENLSFYVNGELSNPVSLYNGMEAIEGEKVIPSGESAKYAVRWVLTPDSGIITHYGNEFTVQWEYCGIKSQVVAVNIKEKTAK